MNNLFAQQRIAFLLAVSFLSRIPIPTLPTLQDTDIARSALWYPVVGLLLGVLLCLPLFFVSESSALLLAACLTVLWVLLTGGLHVDGLADSADGWLGGLGDRERSLEIMHDSRCGAAGVMAVAALLLLKCAALAVLIEAHLWWLILFAPVLGRVSILLLVMTTPYARPEGLGQILAQHLSRKHAVLIIALGLVSAVFLSFWATVCVGFIVWRLRALMIQRLQGCTGDTTGALVECVEAVWLMACGFGV